MSRGLAALVVMGSFPPAQGQITTTQAVAPPRVRGLADAYIDGSEEFSVQPPMDWQLSRQRLPDARGATVLKMTGPGAGSQLQEIIVRRISTKRSMPIADMIKNVADTLTLEFTNVRIASQQEQQIAAKTGGFISATYEYEGQLWQRMHAFVESQPRSYLMLVFNGPASLATKSEPLFQLVVSSLAVLPRKVSEAELKTALDEGINWLGSLKEADLHWAVVPEQFFKIETGGRLAGFLTIQQTEFVWEGRPGVRIAERGWTFEADGRARNIEDVMFLGDSLQDERWKTNVTTLVPATDGHPAFLKVGEEQGLRTKDVLLSSQAYAFGPTLENPGLRLPRSYVSRVLVRLLPRLADPTKPRRMAFTTFDHLRADLVVRIVELAGESELPGGTSRGKVFRIEEREGLASDPSPLFVDEDGKVLYMKSGQSVMTPVKREEVERSLASRVADADRQMTQLEQSYSKEEERFRRTRP